MANQKLIKIWLFDNQIEVIEENTFAGRKELQEVILSENRVQFVGIGAFNSLAKLEFSNNPCYSGLATNTTKVLKLVEVIYEKCSIKPKWYENEVFGFVDETTEHTKTEHELQIERLTAEINQLKLQLAEKEKIALDCKKLNENLMK